MTTVVSWNIDKRLEPWRQLLEMDADVALLQEAGEAPPDVAKKVDVGPREAWDSHPWNSEWWRGRWSALYDRWLMGEPADSRNVVTYYLRGKNPETASNNQLDYAFASRGFHKSVQVRALNSVEEWGASDHCRLLIEIAGE